MHRSWSGRSLNRFRWQIDFISSKSVLRPIRSVRTLAPSHTMHVECIFVKFSYNINNHLFFQQFRGAHLPPRKISLTSIRLCVIIIPSRVLPNRFRDFPVAQALLPVQRQPQSQTVNADYNRPATTCHLSEAKNLNVPSLISQPGSIKPSFRMIDLRTANPLTASD